MLATLKVELYNQKAGSRIVNLNLATGSQKNLTSFDNGGYRCAQTLLTRFYSMKPLLPDSSLVQCWSCIVSTSVDAELCCVRCIISEHTYRP